MIQVGSQYTHSSETLFRLPQDNPYKCIEDYGLNERYESLLVEHTFQEVWLVVAYLIKYGRDTLRRMVDVNCVEPSILLYHN